MGALAGIPAETPRDVAPCSEQVATHTGERLPACSQLPLQELRDGLLRVTRAQQSFDSSVGSSVGQLTQPPVLLSIASSKEHGSSCCDRLRGNSLRLQQRCTDRLCFAKSGAV